MAGKRTLTEAQKAALARGRARLRQKQSTTAATAPAKRTASASPARTRPPGPVAAPDVAVSAPKLPTTSSDLPASSSDSPPPALDADALNVFFESDSADAEGQPSSGGVLGAILGTSAGPSATASKSTVKPDKLEEAVARATDEWQEVAAQLFILVGGWVASKELAPTTPEAEKITRPLIRILMRHYDPAREASNDVLDLVAASVAMAYYLDRVGPAWASKRAEQKVRILRGTNGPAPTAKPVRIERPDAARSPSVAAAGPAGPAGLHPDAVRRDAGAVPPGDAGSRERQSAHQFDGEAVIEEFTYGPLIPVA